MLTEEIIKYIDQSVLCWLATTSTDYQPNVSPKELFGQHNNTHIYIANVASPKSFKNIKSQAKVCVSFIDILEQKGYQIYGQASILEEDSLLFKKLSKPIIEQTQGKYPFNNMFYIEVKSIKPILAPSYLFFPETKKEEMIHAAKAQYGLS